MTRPISKSFIFLLLAVLSVCHAEAQKQPFDTRINILFGLSQPLVAHGFNVEGNFFYRRLAFDYSHGASLDFYGSAVSGDLATQKLAVHVPFTTGFGVGYRFTENFSLRIEPKWHRWEIYYDGEARIPANQLVEYTTFTLGVGAYYCWRPFRSSNDVLRGLMIAPSLRFWPRMWSSLADDKFVYTNKFTNQQETHKSMNAGVGNTPVIVNISIGYSFDVTGKRR